MSDMKNQTPPEEITIEQLEKLICGLDYESEIGFDVGAVHCTVRYVPIEKCKEQTLCFEHEKIHVKIPYETIKKIVMVNHFNGLWYEVAIKCTDNMEYKLRI